MLYSEQMKEICEKLGVNPADCKDGLYSTLLQTISDACDGGGGSGGGDDWYITNGQYLFYEGARLDARDAFLPRLKDITNIRYMFFSCTGLKELDVSKWDTSNVTSMQSAFAGCTGLKELDVSKWDTSKVKAMNDAFARCKELKKIDVSNWDTSNVTDMMFMFEQCSSLRELDMSKWNTSKVLYTKGMFSSCSNLKELDISNFDTSQVIMMDDMFKSCAILEKIVGFSATNKAGITIGFPSGSSSARYALKRLIFRTDLPEGVYSIRSAIKIPYCSFYRDGMVEMFNTLPDVSGLGLTTAQSTITITGNLCLCDTAKIGPKKVDCDNYGEFIAAADAFYGDYDRTGARVTYTYKMPGYTTNYSFTCAFDELTEELWNEKAIFRVEFQSLDITVPDSAKLTAEDEAIATSKGWTLVK